MPCQGYRVKSPKTSSGYDLLYNVRGCGLIAPCVNKLPAQNERSVLVKIHYYAYLSLSENHQKLINSESYISKVFTWFKSLISDKSAQDNIIKEMRDEERDSRQQESLTLALEEVIKAINNPNHNDENRIFYQAWLDHNFDMLKEQLKKLDINEAERAKYTSEVELCKLLYQKPTQGLSLSL